MKKITHLCLLLSALFVCLSCVDDSSDYGGRPYSDIKISGIKNYYFVYSYENSYLTIEPTIECGYDESELRYEWYIYDPTKEDHAYGEEPPYEAMLIGEEKNLNYEMNLESAKYTVVLKVISKENEIMSMAKTEVDVTTRLSRGFYILKETAEGNSELDLFVPGVVEEEVMRENLLQDRFDAVLEGAPRCIDICYNQAFRDPDKLEQGIEETIGGNNLFISTQADKARFIRTSDFRLIYDEKTLYYEIPEVVPRPYRALRGYFETYYVTDNGVYATYEADNAGGGSPGKFGKSVGNGGSTHVAYSSMNIWYWSEANSGLGGTDFNGGNISIGKKDEVKDYPIVNTPYECLTCGTNNLDNITYFLLQEKANPAKKVIYFLETGMSSGNLSKVVELDENSCMSRATVYATNALQATLAYCVVDNKLYAYDLAGLMPERELELKGIPAGETITYLSNQYLTYKKDEAYMFDYLLVGTQKGNTYHLYMYKMVGGEPDGQPVYTVTGTGKIFSVQYVTPLMDFAGVGNYSHVDR